MVRSPTFPSVPCPEIEPPTAAPAAGPRPPVPRFPRRWGALARVGLVFLALGGSPLRAQLSTVYEEPDLTTPVFAVDRLGLEPQARSALATVLAAGVTYFNATLDAKIIGVALRLDPQNRAAREAADCRQRGELPEARPGAPKPCPAATVLAYLTGQSAGLRAKGGPDNLALAAYLSDIAADLDPHNPAARYEKATCASLQFVPAWTFLRGKEAAPAERLPLLKKQSKIHGLGVSELPGGERTGAVLEMIVTAEEAHSREEVGVVLSQPVGESMHAGLAEAQRAVKLRHPSFGAGQRLVVSFGDIHGGKDGPSGDAAFTLLLFSLYDPLKLAADCAITGDITVDGRVRAVGAVPSKIHAALAGGCRIVAVPKENASAVADVPFLYGANTLWKLQVFTVDTLDDALAVMREDRPADLQRAIDLFAAVQRRVGPETPYLSAAHADIVPSLREILRLAPGHASAAAMLKLLEGRMPSTLSLSASWDEVHRITQATLDAAGPGGGPRMTNPLVAAGGIDRLEALLPRLDYRVTELCAAAVDGLRALQRLDSAHPSSSQYAEYRQRLSTIQEVERRMQGNPSLMEALRH